MRNDSRLSCSMLKSSRNQRKLSQAVALRYLRTTSSTVTGVGRMALMGLTLSVAVLVIVISVVNGFERELRERVMSLLPGLKVHLTQQSGLDRRLQPGPYIAGAAPVVEGSVLLTANKQLKGVQLTGIDPSVYGEVSALGQFLGPVDLTVLRDARFGIILGAGLARDLDVGVGDRVRLIVPVGAIGAAGSVPRQREMTVAAIANSQSLLDSTAVFTTREIASKLLRAAQDAVIHVRLADLFAVAPAITRILDELGDEVRIDSWMDTYGNLYQAIAVQKLTLLVLLSFLVAVAAFNLVSGLVMIVERRREDVAIMATFGMRGSGVLRMFLLLGGYLASAGILLGLLLGSAFALALPKGFEFLSWVLGGELMSQYFITYLPVDVRPLDLAIIGLTALVLALLATILPAIRATRFQPSRVLAHE